MSTIAASTCWPSRFWLRCLAVFLAALAVGMLIAVFRWHPATEVKARVVVLNAQGAPIAARVYRNARSRAEMRDDDYFTVKGNTSKSLSGGRRDFMVWALDDHEKPVGEPEHQQVDWPAHEGQTVTFRLQGAPPAAVSTAAQPARPAEPITHAAAPPAHPAAQPQPPPAAARPSAVRPPIATPPPGPSDTHAAASGRPTWVDHPLRPEDTQGKGPADIQAMVNELYAAAGYRFHKQAEDDLFEKKGYKLTLPDMTQAETAMSPVQRDNLRQLQEIRDAPNAGH